MIPKGNILILRQFNTNFLYFKLDQRGMPLMDHMFIKISKWKMYPGSRSTSQRTKSPESQAIGSRSRIHFPFSNFDERMIHKRHSTLVKLEIQKISFSTTSITSNVLLITFLFSVCCMI